MKKLLILFSGFVLSLFFIVNSANAETIIYEQLNESYTTNNSNYWSMVLTNYGSSLNLNGEHINDIALKGNFSYSSVGTGVLRAVICDTIDGIYCFSQNTTLSENQTFTDGDNFDFIFHFTSDYVPTHSAILIWVNFFKEGVIDTSVLTNWKGKDQNGVFHNVRNGSTWPSAFEPYIKIGKNIPFGNMSIDEPMNNSILVLDDTVTFSGDCSFNGTDQLKLLSTYDEKDIIGNTITGYDLDCVNHAWSVDISLSKSGSYYMSIYDKTESPNYGSSLNRGHSNSVSDYIVIRVQKNNPSWGLSLIYPDCELGRNCTNLQVGNWTFRFGYNIPNTFDVEDVFYELWAGCNDDYSECDENAIDTKYLDVVDPGGTNSYFDSETGDIEAVSGEFGNRYYFILLKDSSGVEQVRLYFNTLGVSSGGQSNLPPGQQDLGFWGNLARALLVPNPNELKKWTNDLTDSLKSKLPFGIFYTITDKFENSLNVNSSTYTVSVPINVAGLVNINAPVFGSNDVQTKFEDTMDWFRPWITWGLWISFLTYCWVRIRNIQL
jgi:hypothetical protein